MAEALGGQSKPKEATQLPAADVEPRGQETVPRRLLPATAHQGEAEVGAPLAPHDPYNQGPLKGEKPGGRDFQKTERFYLKETLFYMKRVMK